MKKLLVMSFTLSLITASGSLLAGNITTCFGEEFDAEEYLLANRDVKAAGVDACKHYTEYGKKEGRSPKKRIDGLIICNGDLFDPDGYMLVNPDVEAVGADACSHYTTHGKKERRLPNPKNRGGQYSGPTNGMGGSTTPSTPPKNENPASSGNTGSPEIGPAPSGGGQLLNGAPDWNKWLPTSVSEVWYNTPSTSDIILYHHVTHSILNIQSAYDSGLKAIGHLKVQGKKSGIVYAETIQKQGAIRNDMTGENKYGNNHPMNVYGVGLEKDSVLKLPKNEILIFTWTNRGTSKIMADLIHPNADPSKNVNFKQCLNPGESTSIEYNPAHYNDLKEWHQDIKSNMNAYGDCY